MREGEGKSLVSLCHLQASPGSFVVADGKALELVELCLVWEGIGRLRSGLLTLHGAASI